MNLNSEFAKLALMALLAPLWWPFMRELWKEMNNALSEEGGILGRPTPVEEQKDQPEYISPMVSIPFRDPVHRNRAAALSSATPGTSGTAGTAGTAGPSAPASRTRPKGFERKGR